MRRSWSIQDTFSLFFLFTIVVARKLFLATTWANLLLTTTLTWNLPYMWDSIMLNSTAHLIGRGLILFYFILLFYFNTIFINLKLHVGSWLVYDIFVKLISWQNHHVTEDDDFFFATVATFRTFCNFVTKFAHIWNFVTILARNVIDLCNNKCAIKVSLLVSIYLEVDVQVAKRQWHLPKGNLRLPPWKST
jgi:hypothetical protein